MSTSTYTLSACTPSDVPGMVRVYLAAFESDPFNPYLFPSTIPAAEIHRWLNERFTKIFNERWIRVTKITAPDGTMCAFLRYSVPHTPTPEEVTQQEEKDRLEAEAKAQGRSTFWPVGANLPLLAAKFGAINEVQKKHVVKEEWYVAHLLATHPDHQRKGLASRLLQEMLDQADRDGKKAWIEATDAGYPVYCKLGWTDVDAVEVDLTPYGGKGMARNRMLKREPVVVEKVS